ncbi:MAG: FKBP-type peptidyl-prolyl cis-trans isomerase [Candidatus Shapirobacteria bacterium]|nr:FKBP-type peptidyl-prolyl cis-trans isomerase [Candidatus Shapirobacteria bacterium]
MSKRTLITVPIIFGIFIGLFILLSQKPKNTVPLEDFSNIPLSVTPTPQGLKLNIQTQTKQTMTDLKIEDLVIGTGAEVKSGDTIEMNYVGTLVDGTKFDSSYDRGVPFETQIGVGQVIKGWDQGVPGMKVGGKRRLLIPSALAYGAQGAGGVIPPNADLIFEVELVSIKN